MAPKLFEDVFFLAIFEKIVYFHFFCAFLLRSLRRSPVHSRGVLFLASA
jgi:hypothetical protein